MEHFKRAQLYRRQAADCRRQAAATVTPPEVREQWLELAERYEELAKDALKLSTIKGEELEPG